MEFVGPLILLVILVPVVMLQVEVLRARNPKSYFSKVGVVVRTTDALDEMSEVIGRYMGAEIFNAVVFKGMRYEFERVAPPIYKEVMRGRELYLHPGLLYVAR
jgi:hypothetical protein